MRKFITLFLTISALFITKISANTQTEILAQSSQDSNFTQTKKDVEKLLSQEFAKDINKSEVFDIIVDKIAQNEIETKKSTTASNHILLYNIINDLKKINLQKATILKNSDMNASKVELKNLDDAKAKIFDKLPFAITQQTIDKEKFLQYLSAKKSLENTIKKYEKKQNSEQYINAMLDLERMKVSENFYSSLIKIEKLFVDGANKTELEDNFNDMLLSVQTIDLTSLNELRNKISDDALRINFDEKFTQISNDKKSYEEILSYLSQNSDLLASSVVFTSLNFRSVIEWINDKVDIQNEHINIGKIVLITFITLFFYSLRKLLATIIYFFFKFFNKSTNLDNETLKTQVVSIIKKPMGVLLLAYSIDICAVIFFYPAPVPLKFASALSIIYIILWCWLFIEIIDGYGVVLIGSIAKKGIRKDVVNLVMKILYVVVIIIGILLVLRRLGFDVSAILASLGIGGLAIAFATKDIIANFFQSIMLLFDNSFVQGDHVVVGDIEGTVVETGFRKTTIRTFDNALVFVPNANIMAQNIKNWNRRKVGRNLNLLIGVEYGASAAQLKKCVNDIKEMLKSHKDIAQSADNALNSRDFRMRYRQNMVSIDDLAGYKSTMNVVLDSFGDSSINILVYCFTKSIARDNYLEIKEDILFKIMEIVEQNGLTFAFPSQSIYIEKLPKISYDNDENLINLKRKEDVKNREL